MSVQTRRHRKTIYLKRCPRCKGDIGRRSDQYGVYVHCLQCGYMADLARANSAGTLPSHTAWGNTAWGNTA